MAWSWVIIAKNGRKASLRLEKLAEDGQYQIPPFLILHTLRRKPLGLSALRKFIPIIENLYSNKTPLMILDEKTKILLFIRLLRRCRETWPEGMTTVVDMVLKYLRTPIAGQPIPAWMTHTYNRFLSLISIPTSKRPYKNLPILQRCQFAVLRKMGNVGAPITREGYRAIVAVQLAHEKQENEKNIVRFMSTNWPPWPVEKDGWNATYGQPTSEILSRAGIVLRQMVEAGYSHEDWEKEASVLAGKDTDTSPTIQTRTFKPLHSGKFGYESRLWAARIRATRTLEEAWWNFLDCRESMKHRVPGQQVWDELFEKVLIKPKSATLAETEEALKDEQENIRYRHTDAISDYTLWCNYIQDRLHRRQRVVPGDAKEVMLAPRNPADGVYIPEPPKDAVTLFFEMLALGLKPSTRTTTHLVRATLDSDFASRVLKEWNYDQYLLFTAPLKPQVQFEPPLPQAIAHPKVFTAFLYRLRKLSAVRDAVVVLRYHKPAYVPAWNTVLLGLAQTLNVSRISRVEKIATIEDIWKLFTELRSTTEEDEETLRILAVTTERACRLCVDQPIWDKKTPIEQLIEAMERHLGILSISSVASDHYATPVLMHAYVRALGYARRWKDIVNVVAYLQRAHVPLDDTMGKRVLIAARAFLSDVLSLAIPKTQSTDSKVDVEVRQQCLQQVAEMVVSWKGGWGADEDMQVYCIRKSRRNNAFNS